ncbi:Abi-alpha family protein [Ferribacterium limneticum]|uniref:Abi-alpha family protein n=1 Tax=Ferribacterium limneticum TaxID=76259 RepID=UPI001CF92C8C|nr:Abi-alpha family protein [Ferribacterium limneticum]UCV22415.1 DUF4393 domain-containing protein [Ferribacterium limneticum]
MPDSSNEVTEVARATQELAKTAQQAIGATEQLGTFVARFIAGSLEQAAGIVEDKLRYMRWERQCRLMMKAREYLGNKGLDTPTRPLPMKLAIPLLQAATLEDDDGLQDIWAKLLVNFATENSGISPKRAFIDILESISPLEAKLIALIYELPYEQMQHRGVGTQQLPLQANLLPEDKGEELRERLKIEPIEEVKFALANLDRLGVLSVARSMGGGQLFGFVNPTLLGKAFFDACSIREPSAS